MPWAKIFPFFQLVLPLLIAVSLVSLQLSEWRSSESMAQLVNEYRATVAIFVQVLAFLLGMLQVQALCTTFRYTFTVRMPRLPVSLRDIEFVYAASLPKLSFKAGTARAIGLVLIVALSLVPAALFSAALTPVQALHHVTQPIHIPTFDTNQPNVHVPIVYVDPAVGIVDPHYFRGNLSTALPGAKQFNWTNQAQWVAKQGLYTYDATTKREALTNAASDASLNRVQQKVYPKLDNTGYFYVGRSYGAGTAAGFAELRGVSEPKWYDYAETGFETHVSCHFNESMAFELLPIENDMDIAAYTTNGTHPDPDQTPVIETRYFAAINKASILAWTTLYPNQTQHPNDKGIYVSVRALANGSWSDDEWGFRFFDKVQCRIDFQAQKFRVHVNEASKVISVSPDDSGTHLWPYYGNAVASELRWWLWLLSSGSGCQNGCPIGRGMRLNEEQLRNVDSASPKQRTLLRSVEDYLANIVDNTLNLLASTRYVSAEHSTSVQARITIPAVVFGSRIYSIIVLIISRSALLIYLIAATWTHLWRDMVELDLTSMAQVISSALVGGNMSAPETLANLATDGSKSKLLLTVHGDQADPVLILEECKEGPEEEKLDGDNDIDDTTQQTSGLAPHSFEANDHECSAG